MMKRTGGVWAALAIGGLVVLGSSGAQDSAPCLERSVAILREALQTESGWVRVHAAEALLHNGLPEGVEETYLPEADTAPPRHRIGVWRVMAQDQQTPEEREHYVQRIRMAFLDLDGPDRLHAAETLGKLGDTVRSTALLKAAVENSALAAYARLILANTGAVEDAEYLAVLLGSYVEGTRLSAAYSFRFVPRLTAKTLDRLRSVARNEPESSRARIHLLIAWLAHADAAERSEVKRLLTPYARSPIPGERYQFGESMAVYGDANDMPRLVPLLDDEDADVRISIANAVLAIERRRLDVHNDQSTGARAGTW